MATSPVSPSGSLLQLVSGASTGLNLLPGESQVQFGNANEFKGLLDLIAGIESLPTEGSLDPAGMDTVLTLEGAPLTREDVLAFLSQLGGNSLPEEGGTLPLDDTEDKIRLETEQPAVSDVSQLLAWLSQGGASWGAGTTTSDAGRVVGFAKDQNVGPLSVMTAQGQSLVGQTSMPAYQPLVPESVSQMPLATSLPDGFDDLVLPGVGTGGKSGNGWEPQSGQIGMVSLTADSVAATGAGTVKPMESTAGDFTSLMESLGELQDQPASHSPALPAHIRAAMAHGAAQTVIPTPFGQSGWNEQVSTQVAWFSSKNINAAEIALNPAELGPVHVRISTSGDQTSVTFTSHHAAVRDALDQSLPRLREMFADQGLTLVNVDVSDQNSDQRGGAMMGGDPSSESHQGDFDLDDDEVDLEQSGTNLPSMMTEALVPVSRGLVDERV